MTLTGELIIGAALHRSHRTFAALAPESGMPIAPDFYGATSDHVEMACALAEAAFDAYRETPRERRAVFLEAIAANIEAIAGELVPRAMAETALPRPRLEGELARTAGQLRLFAAHLRLPEEIRIDPALPDRRPLPRPDLRLRRIAVGPVAVFGSSNFPLAFSVAGGDTAAALAAGCPVIIKAHAAHPGTSELVGRAVQNAVASCGLPEGVFSLLFDDGFEVGQALVRHPAIQAVGFTGSRKGGLALLKLAQARPQPIPVYAEMSSVNPVFLLQAALEARAAGLGSAFVESLTLGVGQFCTNPGIVIGVAGEAFEAFIAAASTSLRGKPAGVMLTAGIAAAYGAAVARMAAHPAVQAVAHGLPAASPGQGQPALFAAQAADLLADPSLMEEVFGPCALLVRCKDTGEMHELAHHLEGQLTATLQADEPDLALARKLLTVLERKAGRILANGWPTGVEVCDAMVHGGPYPATSDTRTTSVGTMAIERFLRPVCYQAIPGAILPAALQTMPSSKS
ncbi:MAG TPA: aldehyde dehydrogenase (NADP(+)) [Acidocella sp.]|jgi:alpha-ketoglutaric semialdehyde dehydrogenase|uniref:aldehyde dehydrogenase (NADP(+)) n=1 Tax=Acidocella sp. TaxID=50710 RepID=UPI002CBB538F|nr:aldehyde dehydrogenase (NADP(+)) [Acidocella sp.]HVE23640.1 aldehyde dehydrogenase (NADP(+)) [Acidocella sp.]